MLASQKGWGKPRFYRWKSHCQHGQIRAAADGARGITRKAQAEVREGIPTEEIKRTVLEELKEKNPGWERN